MKTAPTSPEPTQGEPHPAVRLAEAVCALLAAIAGPSWFWRFLPGGRAFWEQMHRMGQDFAALMHRLAALPPSPALIQQPALPPRHRSRARSGEVRPRQSTRQPRTVRAATAMTPRRRPPSPFAPRAHMLPRPRIPPNRIAMHKRRSPNNRLAQSQICALFVSI